MKKYLSVLIIILTGLILVSCNGDEEEKVFSNTYYDHGIGQLHLIYELYDPQGTNRFSSFSPQDPDPNSDKKGSAALWGYGALLTAVAQAARVNPEDNWVKEKASLAVDGLKHYRFPSLEMVYYTSNLNFGGEPYYDDNAWVVLGLFDLYRAYGNEEHLQHSRDILDYVLSGESEDGGIYWKETVVSRNTCSTGPAIVGALLHHKVNPEDELLATAIRLYDWAVKALRDPNDFVYWDNAIYNFETGMEQVNKTKWTYNSGTMIWSAVLLYEITGEEKYLEDAKLTASGALAYFYKANANNQHHYPSSPWFNLYLMRGFLELAIVVDDGSFDYMVNTFKTSMNNAILKGKDDRGVIMRSWGSGGHIASDKYVDILDVSATAEVLFLLADFQENVEKEG